VTNTIDPLSVKLELLSVSRSLLNQSINLNYALTQNNTSHSKTYNKTVAFLTGMEVLSGMNMDRNGVSVIEASEFNLLDSSSNFIQCFDGMRIVQIHEK